MGQIRLLFLLRREGPQPMGRLAELFDLSPTASSGFVARIERHGLVVRRHRSDDRRIVECELTEAGSTVPPGALGRSASTPSASPCPRSSRPSWPSSDGCVRRIREGQERPA